jgi:hypothetical protein
MQAFCLAGLIGAALLLIDGRELAALSLGGIFAAVFVYATKQTRQDRDLRP